MLIKNTHINDKLLKFYMKYNKLCNKQLIYQLIEKLKENIRNEKEVKRDAALRHEEKLRKMKEVNKKVKIPFTAKFLSIDETLDHPGFQFLVNNINYKAKNQVYTVKNILHLYYCLLEFNVKTAK